MSRPDLLAKLEAARAVRERDGLLRRARTVDAVQGTHVVIGGRSLLAFCSNDYLGLARHPDVVAALQRAAAGIGVGGTAAHLICGHHREHAALEEELADWTGRERALLFSTGIMANMGVMQALLGDAGTREEPAVSLQDRLNHASLIDGARLAGAELRRYPHADVDGAARQLALRPLAPTLLATDGVFSMDGDIAPLAGLAALCRAQGTPLYVDDAHGLGVIGTDGSGSVLAAGLSQDDAPILMATLGKALGTAGAFVAGSAALIDGLAQFARSYVYTTAMPPALAAATRTAVRLARSETWRRETLVTLIARFRAGASQLGLQLMDSPTPIQPVLVGSAEAAVQAARKLEERGFLVTAIRPPTVPPGKARLRVTLSAIHTEAEVDALLDALAQSL
jgi:8-amino-7-oxononanoate synthase